MINEVFKTPIKSIHEKHKGRFIKSRKSIRPGDIIVQESPLIYLCDTDVNSSKAKKHRDDIDFALSYFVAELIVKILQLKIETSLLDSLCCGDERNYSSFDKQYENILQIIQQFTLNDSISTQKNYSYYTSKSYCAILYYKCKYNVFTVVDDYNHNQGIGLYIHASSINHSCYPNTIQSFNTITHEMTLRAIRPIQIDDEITIAYMGIGYPYWYRQSILLSGYDFLCQCPRCIDDEYIHRNHIHMIRYHDDNSNIHHHSFKHLYDMDRNSSNSSNTAAADSEQRYWNHYQDTLYCPSCSRSNLCTSNSNSSNSSNSSSNKTRLSQLHIKVPLSTPTISNYVTKSSLVDISSTSNPSLKDKMYSKRTIPLSAVTKFITFSTNTRTYLSLSNEYDQSFNTNDNYMDTHTSVSLYDSSNNHDNIVVEEIDDNSSYQSYLSWIHGLPPYSSRLSDKTTSVITNLQLYLYNICFPFGQEIFQSYFSIIHSSCSNDSNSNNDHLDISKTSSQQSDDIYCHNCHQSFTWQSIAYFYSQIIKKLNKLQYDMSNFYSITDNISICFNDERNTSTTTTTPNIINILLSAYRNNQHNQLINRYEVILNEMKQCIYENHISIIQIEQMICKYLMKDIVVLVPILQDITITWNQIINHNNKDNILSNIHSKPITLSTTACVMYSYNSNDRSSYNTSNGSNMYEAFKNQWELLILLSIRCTQYNQYASILLSNYTTLYQLDTIYNPLFYHYEPSYKCEKNNTSKMNNRYRKYSDVKKDNYSFKVLYPTHLQLILEYVDVMFTLHNIHTHTVVDSCKSLSAESSHFYSHIKDMNVHLLQGSTVIDLVETRVLLLIAYDSCVITHGTNHSLTQYIHILLHS